MQVIFEHPEAVVLPVAFSPDPSEGSAKTSIAIEVRVDGLELDVGRGELPGISRSTGPRARRPRTLPLRV